MRARGFAAGAVLLALITTFAFLPVLRSGFISIDDSFYVFQNRHVMGGLSLPAIAWAWTSFHASNWHPLTWASHQLDVTIFGLRPWGHHLTSLLLHVANALLLFQVLFRYTAAPRRSLLAAAIFAVHPLRVESVAWVAERKDVLCAFFFLAALLAWRRHLERPGVASYLRVMLLFVAALLAKPMAVTLPFALLVLDWWPLGRLRSPRHELPRLVAEKLPLLVPAAASAWIAYLAQAAGGSVATLERLPIGVRLANALVALVLYLKKLIVPLDLAVFYPLHPENLTLLVTIAAGLAVAAVTLMVLRATRHPWLAAGWFWYLVTIPPVLGLVQVGAQAMADRYTYLPLIGPAVALVWQTLDPPWRGRGTAMVAASAVVALLMFLTWRQAGLWGTERELYRQALAVTDGNHVANHQLGLLLLDAGDHAAAEPFLREAVRLRPNSAIMHHNLGVLLERTGRRTEAALELREAVRLDPRSAVAHYNLGRVAMTLGDDAVARRELETALELNEEDAAAHNTLGVLLLRHKEKDAARRHFRRAVELDPSLLEAGRNLSLLERQLGVGGARRE